MTLSSPPTRSTPGPPPPPPVPIPVDPPTVDVVAGLPAPPCPCVEPLPTPLVASAPPPPVDVPWGSSTVQLTPILPIAPKNERRELAVISLTSCGRLSGDLLSRVGPQPPEMWHVMPSVFGAARLARRVRSKRSVDATHHLEGATECGIEIGWSLGGSQCHLAAEARQTEPAAHLRIARKTQRSAHVSMIAKRAVTTANALGRVSVVRLVTSVAAAVVARFAAMQTRNARSPALVEGVRWSARQAPSATRHAPVLAVNLIASLARTAHSRAQAGDACAPGQKSNVTGTEH
jgi:hypothetical protein